MARVPVHVPSDARARAEVGTEDPRSQKAWPAPGSVVGAEDLPRVVGGETVLHPPRDRLRATLDADLAVRRTDVGLDGVDRDVGALGDLLVGHPLGDEGE